VTVNVSTQNGTIAVRKMTIVRLNPRGYIISTSIAGLYCGAVVDNAPGNAVAEGQLHGKALKGITDREHNYVIKVWDRESGRDWIYYKVWKGDSTSVELPPQQLSSGAFTITASP